MGVESGVPAAQIRDLRFTWPGQDRVTLDVGVLDVAAGERLFLSGPSGCGKSTLLSLIAGVLVPDAGRVSVLGTDLSVLSGAERDGFRADHVGLIFQLFNLVPYLSVVENVTLSARFSERRRRRAHDAGGVETEARRLLAHLGLAEPDLLRRKVTHLSVGQQQRVAAARALLGSPELVIADEPTSSLDPDRRASFLELLFGECAERKATLLFVSHDPSLAASFDRVLDLRELNHRGVPA